MPKGEHYAEPTAEEQMCFWRLNGAYARAEHELKQFLRGREHKAFRFFPPNDVALAVTSEVEPLDVAEADWGEGVS